MRVLEIDSDGAATDVTATPCGVDALERLRTLLRAGLSDDEAVDDVLLDGKNPWDDGELDGDTLLVSVADLACEWTGWPDDTAA